MPQDTFTVRLIAAELKAALVGGKINKINQPQKEELSLIIYTGKRTLKLTISANASDCGVYFTDDTRENPPVAPNFCMLLRKYLQGAEILNVTTPGFERIIVLEFLCRSDFQNAVRELRVEIMGKYSNAILTENGVILGAMKTTTADENYKRLILAGARYVPPAPQDKTDPRNIDALRALFFEPPSDPENFLFLHVAGLAPITAGQIVKSYRGGDFAVHVHGFIFSDEIAPRVLERDGAVTDFVARGTEGIPFETLSEAQRYFYGRRRAKKTFETDRRALSLLVRTALRKEEKRLQQLTEKRLSCKDMETNRMKGELLTANLYRVERGDGELTAENYYDGTILKIALDPRLSPSDNAQSYFNRYRKQKRTLEYLAPQEAEAVREKDYLETLMAALDTADSPDDLKSAEEELRAAGFLKENKNRKKTEAPVGFRSFEREGFLILAGRNNLQNDRLLRAADPDDLWLHAQKYHSCHVVIRCAGRSVPDSVLLFAAGVCARYSDGKGDKIPVDYCRVKHVKKPPKSKAGFVVYTDYKTVLTKPQEEL